MVSLSKLLRLGAVLMPLTLATNVAQADMPVTYMDGSRALFSLSVPDFWQARAGGDRDITQPGSDETRTINRVIGMSPSAGDGVWVGFISPHGVATFEQGEEYLRNLGQSIVTDPEVGAQKRITVGGRAAVQYNGTGRRDGKNVAFTAVLIDLPRNRMAVSLSVIEAGANPEFQLEINDIYSSFRAR